VPAASAGDVVFACCRYDRPPFASLLLTSVDAVLLDALDDDDAAREGAGNVRELRAALRSLYRGSDALVRVRFELVDATPVSSRATLSSSGAPT
jgi:uncharacterized protein YqfB (UPF0267 family)